MNKELERLYREDQAARADRNNVDWKIITSADKKRRDFVIKMLEKDEILAPKDCYMAAMIMQHGNTIKDYKEASRLAKLAMESGYKPARWLYAAATDRLLMKQGHKQKYGTQYVKSNAKAKWRLYPVDKKVTDTERAKLNVPPLAKTIDNISKLSKNKMGR
jgi:hypothetical protein